MKKLLNLGFLLIAIAFFVSCKSNEPEKLTDIDKIEADLQRVVKENGVTKCSIFVNQSDFSQKVIYSNMDFSISNGFLVISGNDINNKKFEISYNLLYLSNYSINAGQLYFNFHVSVENVTDIDKIETELKRVINENGVTKCTIFVYQPDLTQKVIMSNVDFIVSNGFLVISGYNLNNEKFEIRYNLLYLSDFTVRGGQLYLNFTNIIF